MRRLIWFALLLCMGACTGGKELPMVKGSDPTWALVPDHIAAAELPR